MLLTGAAGFIGSQLARIILDQGHQVMALVAESSDRWRIREIEDRMSIVPSDLRNLHEVKPAIATFAPTRCIHLAWHGWAGQAAAEENLSSLSVSLDLLKLMPSVGCQRFVSAGTCFEYDLTGKQLSEASPLDPANLYALAKKVYVDVAREFAEMAGLSFLVGRLFYSYGPFEDTRRVVPALTLALLRGEVAKATAGEQVRDYLHSRDVASALWAAAQSSITGSINIASGEGVTIADLAQKIAEAVGRPELLELGAIPYREGDPMHVVADASLLLDNLGWKPHFNLDSGIRQTVSWWRDRGPNQ